ncbi:11621_t:CDS:2, partial [Funneliformis mosseae]
ENDQQDIDKNENNSNRKRKKPLKSTYRAKCQKKTDLTRSLKVRVYPNSSQKTLLKQWMGCARLVYNMISHTLEWSFMKNCPYEMLDHTITGAIQAQNEDNQQTIIIHSQYCRESLKFYIRLLHNKKIIKSTNRYKDKNPLLFPLHHEHRRKNHKWPNLEGKVLMDS